MNNIKLKKLLRLVSPQIITVFLSVMVSLLTVIFLSFVPNTSAETLFVAGVVSLTVTWFLFSYFVNILIFNEIKEIYDRLDQLKASDFQISRKKAFNYMNPLKKLNDEVFVYMSKKQKEIEELKRHEAYRREFLANISHELKTPIFAAQGFVHTLLDGAKDDPDVSEKFLQKAARSLDGLDALVHDIMDISNIESGNLKMHFETVDLFTSIQEVFEQLEEKAAKNNIKLALKNKSTPPIMVQADAQRIKQVFLNLVENGIKYGKNGGNVEVKLHETKKYIDVSISDDGIGIAPDDLPHIFERFYRADKSRSRETGGTGLGLAIVKHILKAHNTTIKVKSQPEVGTVFEFRL